MFCNQRQVAHAAGEFVALRLFTDDDKQDSQKAPKKAKKGKVMFFTTKHNAKQSCI